MPNKIKVRKGSGRLVFYDENKVRSSLEKSGASEEIISEILKVVESKLRPRIPTEEIRDIVRAELKKRAPEIGARYNLRSALLRLGPAGFNFEKYVASILTSYGYKTELPFEYQGACVSHEVDVVAEKDNRRMFIEAKFRNNYQDVVNIKDTMATWSRYLDLVEGSKLKLCPHFDEAWIVTNARFTSHALKFAHCKNMVMIGWNHPKERTFANMVDLSALYPLTIVEDLSNKEIKAFADNELMLCREVIDMGVSSLVKKTGLPKGRLQEIIKTCEKIINA